MSKDLIKTIIKGKNITGDDVGRLLLADMAEEYKAFLSTGQVKSIISQNEFNELLNSLTNNMQIERYNRYVSLHNTIKTYMSITRGTAKEVECRLELCKRLLSNIKLSLQSDSIKNSMPLILTEKQYTDLIKDYEEYIADQNYTYIEVFTQMITTIVHNYAYARDNETEDFKPDKELDALLDKYKKEPVKNPDLRRVYNSMYEVSEDGYFTFKGAVMPIGDNREEFLYNCALQNIKVNNKVVCEYNQKDLKKPVDERFFKEVLTPEVMAEHIEFRLYSTPPKTLHKAEIINLMADAYNVSTEDREERKEILSTFTLFCKELPELIELVKTRMSKYKCLKPYKDLPIKDMFKTVISGAELLRDKVPEYRNIGLYQLKEDNPRANNGIAVIKEDILSKYDKEALIDETGNYRQENEDRAINDIVETSFLKTVNDIGREGKNFINSVYEGLKQVNAFNEFIRIVAEVTKLPVVQEAFSYDMSGIENGIDEYNNLLKLLLIITLPNYGRYNGTYDETIKQRDNIFKALPYIDSTKAEVTPEDSARGVEYISDLNNFKGISAVSKPFYILCGCGD